MTHPYRIVVTDDQGAELPTVIAAGIAAPRKLTRARILLKADHEEAGPGWSDAMIHRASDVNVTTVQHVRGQFDEE